MSEQLTIDAVVLPSALVDELRRLEGIAGVRPAVLRPSVAIRRKDGWWIATEANLHRCALAMRRDLKVAARDLFTQAHGIAPSDEAEDKTEPTSRRMEPA